MTPTADAPPARFDPPLRASLRAVGLAGCLLAAGALELAGARAAISVALGAALAAGNLWALARVVTALLPDEGAAPDARSRAARSSARNRGGWAAVALTKTFGLLAVAWLLMRHGIVSPLPMLIGFGSLPIGIAIGSLVSNRGRQ